MPFLRVVNIIPACLSNETDHDTQPSIAVDPANPSRIAITTFTPNPCPTGPTGTQTAPIFVSTDGGVNWMLVPCLPGGNVTNDSSIRFAGQTGLLYASIIRRDNDQLEILRSAFPPTVPMTSLLNRPGADQPWVVASWANSSSTPERVYVTSSHKPVTGIPEANIEFSLDAATAAAPAGFSGPLNLHQKSGGIGVAQGVRAAIHRSGRIYAAFMRQHGPPNVDVVVLRDDNWGNNSFEDLKNTAGAIGQVASTVAGPSPNFDLGGTQRVSSPLAIAVDPRDSSRVYLAWCTGEDPLALSLHGGRSNDAGESWTVGSIASLATNPCLAVNMHGHVALIYQELFPVPGSTAVAPFDPSATNSWRTILARSTNHFDLNNLDRIVLGWTKQGPPGLTSGDLGEFCNLIAVGKDFYGAFSADNEPHLANFPFLTTLPPSQRELIYLRNSLWTTPLTLPGSSKLLDVSNDPMSSVATSVDPFFVHFQTVESQDDFYVRDWTDSATVADEGVEPSLRPFYFTTSDVWNRRGTNPGSFPNDQPENEDPGNGPGLIGQNWLFTRIRRRAAVPSGPFTLVTYRFLVSKLGTGSNYVDASSLRPPGTVPTPDPFVTFAAAGTGPIMGGPFSWTLSSPMSTRLSVAVEISTPQDPFVGSSLTGRAPGSGNMHFEITDDNNKAQRSMGVVKTTALQAFLDSQLFGIVHNAEVLSRDVELRVRLAMPQGLPSRHSVEIMFTDREPLKIKGEGRVVLRNMEPCENRWIGLRIGGTGGNRGDLALVAFEEMLGDAVINGFALGVRFGSAREVADHARERLRSVSTRLDDSFTDERLRFPHAANLARKLAATALNQGNDVFGIQAALESFERSAKKGWSQRLVDLGSLMEAIDTHLTAVQLARGDRADILQTVRWELAVAGDTRKSAMDRALAAIAEPCRRFISDWEERKVDYADAVDLIGNQREAFAEIDRRSPGENLADLASTCFSSGKDLDLFQGRFAELVRALGRSVSV
jgi:hypothetical protein